MRCGRGGCPAGGSAAGARRTPARSKVSVTAPGSRRCQVLAGEDEPGGATRLAPGRAAHGSGSRFHAFSVSMSWSTSGTSRWPCVGSLGPPSTTSQPGWESWAVVTWMTPASRSTSAHRRPSGQLAIAHAGPGGRLEDGQVPVEMGEQDMLDRTHAGTEVDQEDADGRDA